MNNQLHLFATLSNNKVNPSKMHCGITLVRKSKSNKKGLLSEFKKAYIFDKDSVCPVCLQWAKKNDKI